MIDFVKSLVTEAASSLHVNSRRVVGEKEGVGNVLIDADRGLDSPIFGILNKPPIT